MRLRSLVFILSLALCILIPIAKGLSDDDPIYPIYCLYCHGECLPPTTEAHHFIVEWYKNGVPGSQIAHVWFDWCNNCQCYSPHWPCGWPCGDE